VASWAKTLSKEIAHFGITVNNVLPGYTLTGRLDEVLTQKSAASNVARSEIENQILTNIPTGKFATAEEVGAAVAFLCSPIAASINGVNLPVDGGLSMSL
jgi:3-oxoacyl-[acyl-carrier protein] reductase